MRRIVGIKSGSAIYAVEKDQLFISKLDVPAPRDQYDQEDRNADKVGDIYRLHIDGSIHKSLIRIICFCVL